MTELGEMTVAEAAAWLGAAAIAVGVVWRFLSRLIRGIRAVWERVKPLWLQMETALVVLNGREEFTTPDGITVDPVPPMLARMKASEQVQDRMIEIVGAMRTEVSCIPDMKEDLAEVRHEVKHNGGGSIKDAVKRIEERLEDGSDQFETLNERQNRTEKALETIAEAQAALWPAIQAIAEASPPSNKEIEA
jgi:hypothetical protein